MGMEEMAAPLIDRARLGDQQAFRQIVENYSASLFKRAYQLVGNQSDAEDVVQETFVRAFRGLDSFAGQANLSTWLFRIVTNCALDNLRSRKRHPDWEGEALSHHQDSWSDGRACPERHVLGREQGDLVNALIEKLPPKEKTSFVLRHFHHENIATIAAHLDIQPGAAKHAIFRAVRKLRKALGERTAHS